MRWVSMGCNGMEWVGEAWCGEVHCGTSVKPAQLSISCSSAAFGVHLRQLLSGQDPRLSPHQKFWGNSWHVAMATNACKHSTKSQSFKHVNCECWSAAYPDAQKLGDGYPTTASQDAVRFCTRLRDGRSGSWRNGTPRMLPQKLSHQLAATTCRASAESHLTLEQKAFGAGEATFLLSLQAHKEQLAMTTLAYSLATGRFSISPSRKSAFLNPLLSAALRARLRQSDELSTPMTVPAAPMLLDARRQSVPAPHPRSTTISPVCSCESDTGLVWFTCL